MKTILAVFALLLMVGTGWAMSDFDAYVYAVPYNTLKTVSWAPPPAPYESHDGYEYSVFRMETARMVLTGNTTNSSVTIRFKTHGMYVLYVRSFKLINGVKRYGEWGNSLDPTVGIVNGQPRAWVVYVLQ